MYKVGLRCIHNFYLKLYDHWHAVAVEDDVLGPYGLERS